VRFILRLNKVVDLKMQEMPLCRRNDHNESLSKPAESDSWPVRVFQMA
jgi:hypothetical protein